MRKCVLTLVGCILASFVAVAQSPDPKAAALHLQPGAYVWTGASWSPMQQITMAGGGAKHMAKVFVPGLTPQMVWTFRDSKAPVQVADGMPLFCFKFFAVMPGLPYSPSGRDLLIARFDEKKDHRELQTTSGGNLFTFKAGLSKDRMPDIDITGLNSSTYLVSPRASLKAGEYLLSNSSMGIGGYDFGFHPGKKSETGSRVPSIVQKVRKPPRCRAEITIAFRRRCEPGLRVA
jgi:hypothetical protein